MITNIEYRRTAKKGAATGKGVLAVVSFKAGRGGESQIGLQNLRLLEPNGEEIAARTWESTVNIFPHGRISGVVIDAKNKTSIGGVRIRVSGNNHIAGPSTFSDEAGKYTLNGVPVGSIQVTASRHHYYRTATEVHVQRGEMTFHVNFELKPKPVDPLVTPVGSGTRVPAGRGRGHWRTYDVTDGLASLGVPSIFQDREGLLWFGTWDGVSRYDGETFTTFTTADGLAGNAVSSIFQDREGLLWFGTGGGGVSRYDGETFTTFTTADGLADNLVRSILQDREGLLWFGTGGGVNRYDGETFTTFTTTDGLAGNGVGSIFQDREGLLWFGTWGGGVSRYDGATFTTFTTQDGLAGNGVSSIFRDREGHRWFGIAGSAPLAE